jgi:hypothetical protein
VKPKVFKGVLSAILLLATNAHANYLAPGDPDELVPLCVTGFVAALLVAAALYGLYRIRRAHDLLPPP